MSLLRAARNIDCSEDFAKRNFASADCIDAQGKKRQIFTTSIAIADGTNNTHQAILKLLDKHKSRFDKSQRVGFEIQTFKSGKKHGML